MNTLKNFNELKRLVSRYLGSKLGQNILSMLDDLQSDETDNGLLYAGFENAPAAVGNHHACKGGLVAHYLEMWNIWQGIKGTLLSTILFTYSDPVIGHSRINDSDILIGILIHDLHKARFTFRYTTDEDRSKDKKNLNREFVYGSHPSNTMLTNNQKTAHILTHYSVDLDLVLLNCLYNSEGGFASERPKDTSILAKIVYVLDELSSNVSDRLSSGKFFSMSSTDTVDPTQSYYNLFPPKS